MLVPEDYCAFTFMHSPVTLDDIVVVIVDDDEDIRFSLAKYLSGQGARVLPCSSAGEALEAVRAHHPNIVLSDIGLQNRDGFQLLQDIRSLDAQQGRDVPVIAMTAFGFGEDRAQRLRNAFHAHLNKPFRPDRLVSAVVSTRDNKQSNTRGLRR